MVPAMSEYHAPGRGASRVLGVVRRHRDRFGGGLIALLGLGTAGVAGTYPIGTLREMGAGLMPLMLGGVMVVLGGLIALQSAKTDREPHEAEGLEHPEWRGWMCIIGGVVSFIALAQPAGLLPATFACVFIAARGDREATLRSSLLLAAGISVVGVLVFYYGLRVQLPPLGTWAAP